MSVWKLLLLPWFALHLGVLAAPSVIRLAWPESWHLTPLVPAAIFAWLIMGGYFAADPSRLLSQTGAAAVQAASQAQLKAVQKTPLVSPDLQEEINYWLGWQQQQPTHRGILLNLAELYRAAGDEVQAQFYWQQAQQVDPNHPGVKQKTSSSQD